MKLKQDRPGKSRELLFTLLSIIVLWPIGAARVSAAEPAGSLAQLEIDTAAFPSLSADGRYVAFLSRATNLIPGRTGIDGVWPHLYVKDLMTGKIVLADVSENGQIAKQGARENYYFSMDGRHVVFRAFAAGFLPNAFDENQNNYIKDLETGSLTHVNVNASGQYGTIDEAMTEHPSLSSDGRFVAFRGSGNNFVPNDTNGYDDCFVKDMLTGTVVMADSSAAGVNGDNGYGCLSPVISPSGRYVAFNSTFTNLIPGEGQGPYVQELYIKDLQTGQITRGDDNAAGALPDYFLEAMAFSANDRYLLMKSNSANLVHGDTNGFFHIFVKDLETGSIERASASATGEQANNHSIGSASISDDGRFVAFNSLATNLVPGEGSGQYVKDMASGAIHYIGKVEYNDWNTNTLTGDGRYVAFMALSSSSDQNFTVYIAGTGFRTLGDLDGDGTVSLTDLRRLLRISAGLEQPTAQEIENGDVRPRPGVDGRPYGDGKLTADDAVWVLRRFVGLELMP